VAAGQTRENAEALVGLDAECARGRAWLASLTAEQREQVDQLYRERNAEFARLTAARRARLGPGEAFDFAREWQRLTVTPYSVVGAAEAPAVLPAVLAGSAPRRAVAPGRSRTIRVIVSPDLAPGSSY
jgi:hypothetical protein